MRALHASTYGAPANGASGHPPSSVLAVEGSHSRGSSPRTLYRLLAHRGERGEAGGASGASDSGSDTASVDVSVGTSESHHRHHHHDDHPHLDHVRRWGGSLKGHVESLWAD